MQPAAATACLLLLVVGTGAVRPGPEAFVKPKALHEQSYNVALLNTNGHCNVTRHAWGQVYKSARSGVVKTDIPSWHECDENGGGESKARYVNFYGPDPDAVWDSVERLCVKEAVLSAANKAYGRPENAEIKLLAGVGRPENRIDVVFMGDGYTVREEAEFFADMARLTRDMFEDVTFRAWLPVFNIWALYIPSAESGIGTHGTPRDTHYGLYRDGTQLRGVYAAYPNRAREACALAPGCDFPSIIGNDPYYGGLGGEFVIGTESVTTGTVVLRHEMGHNFVNVGEEYDDGGVYRGVNSDNTRTDIKWSNWLTEPAETVPEQRAVKRLGQYPWVDLATGNQTFTFTSDGTFSRWFLRFTVSGCDTPGSLAVLLDGVLMPWTPNRPLGSTTLDRQFYVYQDMRNGFTPGTHTLSFAQLIPPESGRPIRQLCSLSLHEYGDESEFKWDDKEYVGAYPTWSQSNQKTYRPMNEYCLMRNMSSPHFCKACTEGMWWQFFNRISGIDAIHTRRSGDSVHVAVDMIPLGQFRQPPDATLHDEYTIEWEHNGVVQQDLNNFFSWDRLARDSVGEWKATAVYHTSQ
eukprot:gene12014-18558_t